MSKGQPKKPIEFRLVKDHVIRGRVVNTEGKPIRGVRVGITRIGVSADTSLDSFLVRWKKRRFGSGIGCAKNVWSKHGALFATTTDADGRFTIHGAGVERFINLRLRGAGIAEEDLCLINRRGFDPKPYNQVARDNIPKGEKAYATWWLHGPKVSVVAEAEKPIGGVVTNADTGKPLPGVTVRGFNQTAKTDAAGRYQIHGLRKARSYTIEIASDPSTGYMASQVRAADTAGYQPIRADLRVKKGVIVTGKIIDQATGKPVPGFVEFAALVNNPFAKDYTVFDSSSTWGRGDRVYTAADGAFRIVTIPGPILLMGCFDYSRSTGEFIEWMKYKETVPDAKYPRYFQKSPDGMKFYRFDGESLLVWGDSCEVLEIKPGTAVVRQDLVLERARALKVMIVDADGRPVRGAWASGIGAQGHPAVRIKEASCSAYKVEAGKPRLMVFYHPERKIAGARTLKGDEKQPVAVRLSPVGAIKGRLLDRESKPLAAIVVNVRYRASAAYWVHEHIYYRTKEIITDATGAFTIDELIPELEFQLSFRRRKQRFERATKPADPYVQVKPGACRDLGAIKLKSLPENE